MEKLLTYVLYHNLDQIKVIEPKSHIEFVNLEEVNIDKDLAENRLFFKTITSNHEYIGMASASWPKKYPTSVKLEDLNLITLKENQVYAPDIAQKSWALQSEYIHPGIFAILGDLAQQFNMSLIGQTLWANNFVCHRDVFNDLIIKWKDMYFYALNKYKNRVLPYHVGDENKHRHIAYLGERLTCLYFCNRKDLEIVSTCNPVFVRDIPLPDYISSVDKALEI